MEEMGRDRFTGAAKQHHETTPVISTAYTHTHTLTSNGSVKTAN